MAVLPLKKWLYRRVRDFRRYNWVVQGVYWLLWKFKAKGHTIPIFFVFGMGRSGSTLLVNLINQHPDIYCDGEILKKKVAHLPSFLYGRKAFFAKGKYYGFRAKLYQATREQGISFEGFRHQLAGFDVKWIYIYRSNTWKQALSAQVTKQTRIPNASDRDVLRKQKVLIDWGRLQQEWQNRETIKRDEKAFLADIDNFMVHYESDLLDDTTRQTTMDSLFEYLGKAPQVVKSELKKLSDIYPDIISNYEELKTKMKAAERG